MLTGNIKASVKPLHEIKRGGVSGIVEKIVLPIVSADLFGVP